MPRMKCQISCNSILGCGPVWEKFRWGKWKVSQLCICRGPTIIMWRVLYFVVIFVVSFFFWLALPFAFASAAFASVLAFASALAFAFDFDAAFAAVCSFRVFTVSFHSFCLCVYFLVVAA